METVIESEMTIKTLQKKVSFWKGYFLVRWKIILIITIVSILVGVIYAKLIEKPLYTAEITFATEAEGSPLNGYAGIASQFGIDLGGTGSAFDGENLMELFKSQNLIHKTLLTSCIINNNKQLLINDYIKIYDLDKKWENDKKNEKVFTSENQKYGWRFRDSILKKVTSDIQKKQLTINKADPKLNIIKVKMTDIDEEFCKVFVETLTENIIKYYTVYKTRKSKQNLDILQFQADSVKGLLFNGLEDVASINDLNVNPLKQITRTNGQKRQVDVQANSAMYTEIMKNLELAKISFQKKNPLIQIIDTPVLPLEKTKLGLLKSVILSCFLSFLVYFLFHLTKIALSNKSYNY